MVSSSSIRRSVKPHKRLTALSFAHRFWEALDSPLSLSCHILARYGEYEQLVRKSISADHYSCPLSFYKDYQSVKLMSRFPNLDTGIDTDLVAKKKFIESEVQCRDTNTRFRNGSCYDLSHSVRSVLCRAQRKIATILGDVPDLDRLDFSFGPGAAFGVRGDTSVFKKVTTTLECTHAFTDILQEFLEEFPGWISAGIHDVNIVPGSQMTIVPKNAKTGRPICIEPLLNGLYQKGFGSWIRDRLLRFGIDLRNQSVNQKLAGSAFSENLATVDFSSASDTISYMLVLDLLPITWFEALNVARCPQYLIEGSWYNFHKFTSMGNAYTFELETLIFYALACATCEELGINYETGKSLSVYGDDVIIPQAAYDLYSEVTEACGFTINHEKSFSKGAFYESCGHDFFQGHFVRPLLLSKELNKLPSSFYAANSIKRVSKRFSSIASILRVDPDPVLSDRLRDLHSWIIGCIPPRFRIVGPEGYGDGHLIDGLPKGASRHPSWDGWWFHTYVERPKRLTVAEWPTAYALYSTRGQRRIDCVRDFGLLLSNFVEVPEPLDNGSGYSVRGLTSLVRVKTFCNFTWQDASWDAYKKIDAHS